MSARRMARRMARAIALDSVKADGSIGAGIVVYETIDSVPASASLGSLAFVRTGDYANRYYIYVSGGWRSIGLGSLVAD